MQKFVKVVTAYTALYPNPIVVKKGDELKVGLPDPEQPDWFWCAGPDGRCGWVPKDYIDGNVVNCDYSAVELSAAEGEQLVFLREIYGWAFCQRENGDVGWIPLTNLGEVSV